MTSRTPRPLLLLSAVMTPLLVAIVSLSGCKEEAPPPPPPAPIATNRPPPPPPWNLGDIEMHEKVAFPEAHAPRSEEIAQAIASFASAFASGDSVALMSMLDQRERGMLDEMVEHGVWDEQTRHLVGVRVATVQEQGGGSFRVGIGLRGSGRAYLTGWQATGSGSAWTFGALDVGEIEADQLPALDGSPLQPPPEG